MLSAIITARCYAVGGRWKRKTWLLLLYSSVDFKAEGLHAAGAAVSEAEEEDRWERRGQFCGGVFLGD